MYFRCLLAAFLVATISGGDPSQECGVPIVSPASPKVDNGRIVGGVVAQDASWPWIGAVTQKSANGAPFQYCGGSLIHKRLFLTAGHCVDGTDDAEITGGHSVILGSNRYANASPENYYGITKVVRHEQYNQGAQVNNDIAILVLDRDVQYTDRIRRICLAGPGMQPEENQGKRSNPARLKLEQDGMIRAYVGGWGATKEDGATSPVLLQTTVPIWPSALCEKTMAAINMKKTRMMICGGYMEGTKDSCQGDSGGPLVVASNDTTAEGGQRFYLVGDVSFGSGCARPKSPGIYGHIGNFIPWIKAVIAQYGKQ